MSSRRSDDPRLALGLTGPTPSWREPEQTGLGRVAMHAPLVPFSDREAARRGDPSASPWRTPLDGRWRFRLVAAPGETPPAFVAREFDDSTWSEIDVPTSWALQGFGAPAYTNVLMPFASEPPHVPEQNPTGLYRRRFELPASWSERRTTLTIGSAESVVYVFVNGIPVGMSKDSRLPAEFDVTEHVVTGENVVALAVVQWSDASWLEDQDQWWLPGLHRSVFLTSTPRTWIADVSLCATPGDGAQEGLLSAEVHVGFSDAPLSGHGIDVELFDDRGRRIGESRGAEVPVFRRDSPVQELLAGYLFSGHVTHARIAVRHPKLWSHESPALYRVVITLRDPEGRALELVSQRVGFRSIEIGDNALRINGQPVQIVGVNRHEWDERRGRAVGPLEMRRDLELMKRHHVNAIRCAHYPNDERFLDLCDELGFYVIDEANLETHARWASLCHGARWQTAMIERGTRMVLRDRNHPCVIAWSLGNESGYGPAHDAMAAWIRRVDPTRPLHYEGAIGRDLHAEARVTDIVCPMYPEIDAIVAWSRARRDRRRPLILCEYSHAMGNSNGGLADYFAAFEKHRGLQGGFIWEWCDHGIRREHADGRVDWLYGGDFAEAVHDANFCCDGLVGPDRTIHPAMEELKTLAQPVRVHPRDAARGHLEIENRRWFSGLGDVRARFDVLLDGESVEHGWVDVPDVPARSRRPWRVSFRRPRLAAGQLAHLQLRFVLRRDTAWAARGFELAWAQLPLALPIHASASRQSPRRGGVATASKPGLAVSESTGTLRAEAGTTTLEVDCAEARVVRLGIGDRVVLESGPEACLWRAPVDNDGLRQGWMQGMRLLGQWRQWGLDRLVQRGKSVAASRTRNGSLRLVLEREICGADPSVVARHREEIVLSEDGSLQFVESLDLPAAWSDLPRVGVVMRLPKDFEQLEWLGLGPHETYPDRFASGRFGRWRSTVSDQWVPYVVPQEHGHHVGTRWLALSTQTGVALRVSAPRPFGFSASHHRALDLTAALHQHDLAPRPETVLHLDAAHRGLGTASCGPDTAPRHRVRPGRHRLVWHLRPGRS